MSAMNAEFFDAIEQIEKEKGIPRGYMQEKIQQALLTAFKRDNPDCEDNVEVIMDENKKTISMFVLKTIVEESEYVNDATQILLDEARHYDKKAGIGDTVRVSLTADPVREVYAAKAILKAAGLRREGVNIVSCPTCGRTRIDLIGLAGKVEEALRDCEKPLTVAVMGCVVNGPGEAREADIGIAGGEDCGVLFVRGELKERLPYDELLPALLRYIDKL